MRIVQDDRHEFIIKCFKPSRNHLKSWASYVFAVNVAFA